MVHKPVGFVNSTTVATPGGEIPISELKIGDVLWVFDEKGVIEDGKVVDTYTYDKEFIDRLVTIYHTQGNFTTTMYEYILTGNNVFTKAKDLKVGNKLQLEYADWVEIIDIDYDVSVEDVVCITVSPFHNFVAGGIRVHNGGPREAPNTLVSNTTAEIIDVICEGEIEEITETYLDEVVFSSFTGITKVERLGTASQEYTPNIPVQGSQINVGTELLHAIPVLKQINDTSVDDVRVVVSIPALSFTDKKDGDIMPMSVNFQIYINDILIIAPTIWGKTNTPYQRAVRISNLASISPGPWTLKLRRSSIDAPNVQIINKTYWTSYTLIKNVKIRYNDTALVGYTISAEQFGKRIPSRQYKIKGLKIKVPTTYVGSGVYTGTWDGSWRTEYSSSPIWCYRDMLTSERYGLGVPESMIDDAGFYTEAQYTDEYIDDGEGGTHARYSMDCVLNNRTEANHLINLMASNFMAMPYWSAGKASIVVDRPKDPTRVINNTNVENGEFTYEGSSIDTRYTVCNVSWNDPKDFAKPAVEVVEDHELIERYGYRPIDITAFGCNNRARARRFGRWYVYTSCNQTQSCSYKAGWDHADVAPGEIVILMDEQFANISRQGKLVSSTANSVVLDRPIELEGIETYSIYTVSSDGTVEDNEVVTTGSGITDITIDGTFTNTPEAHSNWLISGTDVAAKQFKVIGVKQEEPGKYEVSLVQHEPDKFAFVEQGIDFDPDPYTNIPTGPIDPPTNLDIEIYTYMEGANWLAGALLSWEHSPDSRVIYYDIQYKQPDTSWGALYNTSTNFYDYRPVASGTHSFRVRAVALEGTSVWLNADDYVVYEDVNSPAPVQNLRCLDSDSTTFDGRDCEIIWESPDTTTWSGSSTQHYLVEAYDNDTDTLLRTFQVDKTQPEFIYTYNMNEQDRGGTAERTLKFKVYSVNYNDINSAAANLVATNPAPDMSSAAPTLTPKAGYLQVEWAPVADTDISHYDLKYGTVTPTIDGGTVVHPVVFTEIHGLEYGTTYYINITPYDVFGVGVVSQTNDSNTLIIPSINIATELQGTVTITDSEGTASTTTSGLYDGIWDSGGVTYSIGATDEWIQYAYSVSNYIDRIGIWVSNTDGRFYIATSENGSSWTYFKAEADHTTTSDGSLLEATNKADAVTNYWEPTAAGLNVGLLPNNIVAAYVRLYMTGNGTSTTVYEFVPARILISELAAIEHLSSYSANIGAITAGTLQSSDYSPTEGMKIDLDQRDIEIRKGGSDKLIYDGATGNLTMAGVLTIEAGSEVPWSTVSGSEKPEDNATVGAIWDTTISGQPSDEDILNEYNINSGNLVRNSDCSAGTVGWTFLEYLLTANDHGLDYNVDYTLENGHTLWMSQTTWQDESGGFLYWLSDTMAVEAGKYYAISGYVGSHRCTSKIAVKFRDSTGTTTGYIYSTENESTDSGGKYLSGYKRLFGVDEAPAGTVSAEIMLRKEDTTNGEATSYGFFSNIMFCEVATDQITTPPLYSPLKEQTDYILPADDSLVGYWSFNEGEGITAYDGSGNSNNGTLSNMVEADWVSGISGRGIKIDDITKYVDCGSGTTLESLTNFTYSAWIKVDSVSPTYQIICGKDTTWEKGFQVYGEELRGFVARATTGSDSYSDGAKLEADQWYHMVMVSDNADQKVYLYVNGDEVSYGRQITGVGSITHYVGDSFTIAKAASSTYDYAGIIDEVRVYNRVLTQTEIKALYLYPAGNNSLAVQIDYQLPSDETLVGYWNFNEGTGTITYDYSGNDNHGTISNGSWSNNAVAGKSITFPDTSNGYIDCGGDTSLQMTGDMSFTAWIRPIDSAWPDVSTNYGIINNETFQVKGVIWRIAGDASNLYFRINNEDEASPYYLGANSDTLYINEDIWSFVAVTYDYSTKTVRHYLNGEFVGSNILAYNHKSTTTSNFYIGRVSSQSMQGSVDQLRAYSSVLTGNEIKALYINPSGPSAASQTQDWSKVLDDDGNAPADNATLGATWGSDISNEPSDLGDINSTEGTKLTGIATGADVTGDNTAADTTLVDGVASTIISGWREAGKTTIDGGEIETDSILAGSIYVVDLNSLTANTGALTVDGKMSVGDQIELGTDGFINTVGKDTYASTSSGIWIGEDSDDYKLNIGGEDNYLKWDGESIIMSGGFEGSLAGDVVLENPPFMGEWYYGGWVQSLTYQKVGEYRVTQGGTYSVKTKGHAKWVANPGGLTYWTVYKNSVTYGVEHSVTHTVRNSSVYSEDLEFDIGDLLQLYVKISYPTKLQGQAGLCVCSASPLNSIGYDFDEDEHLPDQ